jgi:hypothetical protein
LCILYNEKGLFEKTLKAFLNSKSEEIFDFIEEHISNKNQNQKKVILERYLGSLLELNADRTVTQIIIPFFTDTKIQKVIVFH